MNGPCEIKDEKIHRKPGYPEEKNASGEGRCQLACQPADCLTGIYDITSGTLSPSSQLLEIFPFPDTLSFSPESLIENGTVHKESIPDFLDFYQAIEQGKPEKEYMLHLKTNSGKYRWFSSHYSLEYNENQVPLKGHIFCRDITDQYEKELACQRWMLYMRGQKTDCIGYYECNLKYDLYSEIFGETACSIPEHASGSFSDAVSYTAEHRIFPDDKEMYLKFFNKNQLLSHYYRGSCSLELEYRRLRPDGGFYWTLGMVQIIYDSYTDTIRAFILIKNIDEAKRDALALQELSKHDSLTGILNRAAAIRAIHHTLRNSQVHHVLIILDIDRFKQLNDSFGHQFGDKALCKAALRVKAALRRDDIFGRLGGDEFIILLKDVSYSIDLYSKLENLCSLIAGSLEPEIHISASLGTATYPEDGSSFEELYGKADTALYHAKRHGRNQYAVYEPEMCMVNPETQTTLL